MAHFPLLTKHIEQKSKCTQPTAQPRNQPVAMDLNPPEFWWCSACIYANNPWGLVECEMCGAAVRKEAKRPREDAAPPAAASKLAKKEQSWLDGDLSPHCKEQPRGARCPPHGHGIGDCGDGTGGS